MEHNLTEGSIKPLVRKIAIPAVVGFFFNTMYNVVDTYFGGKVSTEALAALSLSFPVFFLIIALSSGAATGVTALIANALGAKKIEEAKEYAGQAVSYGIFLSILLTVVGVAVSPAIFKLLGAEDTYLEISLSYMIPIFYGSIFFILIAVFNAMLQSVGNTWVNRNFLIAGFFLNCLLDPWLLYGGFGIPALGFPGIAWATIIVQIAGTIYIGYHATKTSFFSFSSLSIFKPNLKRWKEITAQVLPASLNMMTIGLGIFIITYFISTFGKDAVAAYGIATRIEQISLVPAIGLTIAAMTLIGQNNGAERFDRIQETIAVCMKYGLAIMTLGGVLVFAFSRPLMAFFTDNVAVIEIGAHYLKIASFIFWAYIILFTGTSALQGMKQPMYAVWVGLYRQILAPVAVFYLLTSYFAFGLNGIWWGIFLVTWSAAIFTYIYLQRAIKKQSQYNTM